jgi:hypothetical protein
VRMLRELAADLVRDGQRLVIARDIGQVGDLLSAEPDLDITVTPSIHAGIAEITATDPPAIDTRGSDDPPT